ncbi:MAG: hypothetical protein M1450_02410 [Patescibacteria group bacterium]|nr:hypothetical protein [Patescibacteria group bacterium]
MIQERGLGTIATRFKASPTGRAINEYGQKLVKGADQLLVTPVKKAAGRIAAPPIMGFLVPRSEHIIMEPIQPEFPPFFRQALQKEAKDPNALFVLVSSHQNWADGLAMAKVTKPITSVINDVRDLEHKTPGFAVLIAKSMATGHQGAFIKEGLKRMQPILSRYNLETLLYTREKDTREYGLKPDRSELRNLVDMIDQGYHIAVFPEASVEGGRKKKRANTVNGMQRFYGVDFEQLQRLAEKHDKRIVVILMGINGAFKIFSSHAKLPTMESVGAIVFNRQVKDIVEVKTELPFPLEQAITEIRNQGQEVTSKTIGDNLGKRTSKLVPENIRGVYA